MATLKEIVNRYGDKCIYCGKTANTIDHYIPLLHGGDKTINNEYPSCAVDNNLKGDMLPKEWEEYRQSKQYKIDYERRERRVWRENRRLLTLREKIAINGRQRHIINLRAKYHLPDSLFEHPISGKLITDCTKHELRALKRHFVEGVAI